MSNSCSIKESTTAQTNDLLNNKTLLNATENANNIEVKESDLVLCVKQVINILKINFIKKLLLIINFFSNYRK